MGLEGPRLAWQQSRVCEREQWGENENGWLVLIMESLTYWAKGFGYYSVGNEEQVQNFIHKNDMIIFIFLET